eukprot:gene16861-biopygen21833
MHPGHETGAGSVPSSGPVYCLFQATETAAFARSGSRLEAVELGAPDAKKRTLPGLPGRGRALAAICPTCTPLFVCHLPSHCMATVRCRERKSGTLNAHPSSRGKPKRPSPVASGPGSEGGLGC